MPDIEDMDEDSYVDEPMGEVASDPAWKEGDDSVLSKWVDEEEKERLEQQIRAQFPNVMEPVVFESRTFYRYYSGPLGRADKRQPSAAPSVAAKDRPSDWFLGLPKYLEVGLGEYTSPAIPYEEATDAFVAVGYDVSGICEYLWDRLDDARLKGDRPI